MADDKKKDLLIEQDDHITLVGSKSGKELRLEKKIDGKGVAFYEGRIDWRKSDPE